MADSGGFEQDLEAAIDRRTVYVAEHVVPALPQHIRALRTGVETIYNVLLKKGLLRADPYQYEEQVSDLDVPADTPFTESERDRELSVRLSAYLARLEYLAQYYDLTLDALDLKRLKELNRFLRFINWRNLTENSTASTTRGIAEQIEKVVHGGDQLSANLLTDAREQLARAASALNDLIRDVLALRREEYKYTLRTRVFGSRGIDPAPDDEQVNDTARAVKSAMPRMAPGLPFARDLVLEIFAENRPRTGEALRREVLERLRVPETQAAAQAPTVDLKGLLLEGARALAMAGRSLEDLARVLGENLVVLEARKLTFGEVLRRVWARLRGSDTESHTIPIEMVDDDTGARRSEDVDVTAMIASLGKRARLYNGILSRGTAWRRLTDATPEAILKFVTKDTGELSAAMRRAEAIETYVKSEVAREQRSQLRPASEQIAGVRDAVQRARRKAQEYVTRSEEIAQLRRLGIHS